MSYRSSQLRERNLELTVRQWVIAYETELPMAKSTASKYIGFTRCHLRNRESMPSISMEHQKRALIHAVNILNESDIAMSLRQQLSVFRQLGEPAVGSDLSIPYTVDPSDAVSISQCVLLLINRTFESRKEMDRERMIECRHALVQVMLDSIELQKGELLTREPDMDRNAQFKESDPCWRFAYVKALGELGFNLGGKVHRKLFWLSTWDPSTEVAHEAKAVYRKIKNQSRPDITEIGYTRAMRAASFELRKAHSITTGVAVDVEAARKVKRTELNVHAIKE